MQMKKVEAQFACCAGVALRDKRAYVVLFGVSLVAAAGVVLGTPSCGCTLVVPTANVVWGALLAAGAPWLLQWWTVSSIGSRTFSMVVHAFLIDMRDKSLFGIVIHI